MKPLVVIIFLISVSESVFVLWPLTRIRLMNQTEPFNEHDGYPPVMECAGDMKEFISFARFWAQGDEWNNSNTCSIWCNPKPSTALHCREGGCTGLHCIVQSLHLSVPCIHFSHSVRLKNCNGFSWSWWSKYCWPHKIILKIIPLKLLILVPWLH